MEWYEAEPFKDNIMEWYAAEPCKYIVMRSESCAHDSIQIKKAVLKSNQSTNQNIEWI